MLQLWQSRSLLERLQSANSASSCSKKRHGKQEQGELIDDKEAPQEVEEQLVVKDAESIQIDGDEYVAVDIYDNDYYAYDDEEEHMFALTEHQEDRRICMQCMTLQKAADKLQQPQYTPQEKKCLVTYVKVNGHPVWMLWDSGSIIWIMPQFAHVNTIHVHELMKLVMLQLGTVGSCTIIHFGVEVKIKTLGPLTREYVDIANFDCYDMIIGMPFMHKNKNSMECQPTGSRVKVEDLVTDEVKEKQQSAASAAEMTNSVRSFWDQPMPPLDMQWAYDLRMPPEWNEVVASMVAQKWAGSYQPSGEVYCQPHADKISEPSDIMFNGKLLKAKSMQGGKAKAQCLLDDVILQLRQQWQQDFVDIINGMKKELPSWREVNHEINLIDENKQYKYHLPWCLRALQEQLHDKTNHYINAKWWEPRSAMQAAPLLCIPKKDGTLQTALDAWQRNDNTIKDVTPLPDQEVIHEEGVAKATYRSKP
ncbi:hypothetical protein C0993_002743, partial [Termitomyces sp. T159_Od127]